MADQRAAWVTAVIFALFWLAVLLAGADFPPPRGFLWIILTVALCAAIVYRRVPTYRHWYAEKRPGRRGRVVLDGLAAGLILALLFFLFSPGEPSVTPGWTDYAIWFAVVGGMGVINAVAIYVANVAALMLGTR